MKQRLFLVPGLLLAGAFFTELRPDGGLGWNYRNRDTDPAGAVVPGAAIVIHDEGTGVDRSITTNDAGVYSAAFLQPGSYDVTASKAGFSKVVNVQRPDSGK